LIIRVTRGHVRPDAEGEVVARLRAVTERDGRPDGLHALYIGRHLTSTGTEIMAITIWRDADTLVRVMGEGWESPKWLAGIAEFMSDSTVEHWETAVEADDPGGMISSLAFARVQPGP